ncbi:MAG TPA: APC family permease [Terriglobales bacterium]|jgi:amino acid transporter|nr:APC family permease [Terriglobales bacterium]
MASSTQKFNRPTVKVFVATTVLLSFISFWRAAAIVLSDLGSSAYYVGGDAEKVIGKSAPWFILAVMLFANCVRALYVESTSMFVRGGVYRVVRRAMGGTLAKFSVSALLFDYVLTGPLSSVVAGQYLIGFLHDIGQYLHHPFTISIDNAFAAAFGAAVAMFFWWKNIQGIHESSSTAVRIMVVTTVMVVILLVWCTVTVLHGPFQVPPNPLKSGIQLDRESLGWLYALKTTWLTHSTLFILLLGFGHSVLAMSGEETLAQVNREIAHPKLLNLKKAAVVIGVYALLFTALTSFFAVMIIPDAVRPEFFGNLIGGIAMHLWGPMWARLIFHGFVVLVGVLILSGAHNTSIVGANGVLNRVAEDGVLADTFQKPHPRFGTSYRIINLVVGLQLLTIVLTRGNVFTLAGLYAFGVIWSFAMMALAILVLRYTEPAKREWKVPGNIPLGNGRELPLGIILIATVLFLTALVNFFTKYEATVGGICFSLVFFGIFTYSERRAARLRAGKPEGLDQFRVYGNEEPATQTLGVRPGNILVAVRDPKNLYYLRDVLRRTETTKQDVVVMTARLYHREHSFSGNTVFEASQVFEHYEQELFTAAVAAAEKEGKPISLLVVPAADVFDAIVATSQRLESSRIVCGLSNKLTPDEQAKLTGDAWERLPEPRPRLILEIRLPNGTGREYSLGPHTPRLRTQDLDLLHRIWLEVTSDPNFAGAHHYHVVAVALEELDRELHGSNREQVLNRLRQELQKRSDDSA